MGDFKIAYLPIGVPTFDLESAKMQFEKSKEVLNSLSSEVISPNDMLLSLDLVQSYIDEYFHYREPDLVIVQNITFANGSYMSTILKHFHGPILLWTLGEPVIDGGRLRLNSLTGAFSAGYTFKNLREGDFSYVFGTPDEARASIGTIIEAARLRKELRELKIAAIGHTPEGFGFGRALDVEIQKVFGATLVSIEVRELIGKAKQISDEVCIEVIEEIKEQVVGIEKIPTKNQMDFARVYMAYVTFIKEQQIGALASRCWPDFFTDFGTPVCMVLGLLNDLGIAASCEVDTYGALSMYIGMALSKSAVFFGDPVSLNEEENTLTFWHCGMAPPSLARKDTGAVVGIHPNRKIGPTLDFGCEKMEEVTVFRVGKKTNGSFRFFVMKGEALDKPKQFNGTSVVVKVETSVKTVIAQSVTEGWEPHFVVIYKDVVNQIKQLAIMLGIEVVEK